MGDRIDIVPVLHHLGAHVPAGIRGGWQPIRCPHPDHDDRHPSASLNTILGRVVCLACGLNEDAPGLLQVVEGLTYPEARRLAEELDGGPRDTTPDWRDLF